MTAKAWLKAKHLASTGSTCWVLSLTLGIWNCGGGTPMPPQSQPSVAISPTSAIVAADGQEQFTANAVVSWQVNGVTGGSTATGTISSSGLYTAPEAAVSVTVEGVSQADSSKSASARLVVLSPHRIGVRLPSRVLLSSMIEAPTTPSRPEEITTSDLHPRSIAAATQLSTTPHSTSGYTIQPERTRL